MKTAIIGGGILGLTLAHRLAGLGHQVEVIEAESELGGLAASQNFGPFVWDRFYHCILPQDTRVIALLEELGLDQELRWTKTGTGYYKQGRFYSMSGTADYLRFPLLSWPDKARLGLTVIQAMRWQNPYNLYHITAEQWLIRWCGERGYETFWKPLLKAKFGPYHDRVAAVFIWATLTRLQNARKGTAASEHLGYVHGGYARILQRFRERLEAQGVRLRTGAAVTSIDRDTGGTVRLQWGGSTPGSECYDHAFFTAATRLAKRVTRPSLLSIVEQAERLYPTSGNYLGVACLVLVLKRSLTPYYVLNVADESIELTGLIEVTNLIDRSQETAGLSLVYLPRYLDSEDAVFDQPDEQIVSSLLDRGVRRLFPDLSDEDIVDRQLHRAWFVQPLPLVQHDVVGTELPLLVRPLTVVNTSMLECATLNNNEVIGLVDRFVQAHIGALDMRDRDGHAISADAVPAR